MKNDGLKADTSEIHSFWEEQAKIHGKDLAATTPDPLLKGLEIEALLRALDKACDTLEIGCGNGHNLLALSKDMDARLVGIDYSAEMIVNAKANNKSSNRNIDFRMGDILADMTDLGSFPQIYTVRCLINLTSLDQQIEAVKNICTILEPGGILALIEPTIQSQEKLNAYRELAGLEPISFHWHNLYIDEDNFLARIPAELELVSIDRFASLYYLISRVFNAKMTPEGETPCYTSEINKIARQLPSVGDLGPHKLFLLKKKS